MSRGKKRKFKNGKKSRNRLIKMPPPPKKSADLETTEPKQPPPKKEPLWKRSVVRIWALVVFIIGCIGYGLYPRVTFDVSQAASKGFISTQFTLENQAVYPIEVSYLAIYVVNMSWPQPFNSQINDLAIWCPNVEIKVRGNESGAIQIDKALALVDTNSPATKLDEGSKIIVRATYKLPFGRLSKTDSALFECGRDSGGNPIWTKKMMGNYANYKCPYGVIFTGKIDGY